MIIKIANVRELRSFLFAPLFLLLGLTIFLYDFLRFLLQSLWYFRLSLLDDPDQWHEVFLFFPKRANKYYHKNDLYNLTKNTLTELSTFQERNETAIDWVNTYDGDYHWLVKAKRRLHRSQSETALFPAFKFEYKI